MSSSTLLKQEVREIGLNSSVPGFGIGTIVLEGQTKDTCPRRNQRLKRCSRLVEDCQELSEGGEALDR